MDEALQHQDNVDETDEALTEEEVEGTEEGETPETPPAPWGALEYGMSVALIAGFCSVCWFFPRGGAVWGWGLTGMIFVAVGCLVGKSWKAGIVTALATAAGMGIAFFCPVSYVYVDNNGDDALLVERDGESWLRLTAGEKTRVRMHGGSYTLTVRSDAGEQLGQRKVSIPERRSGIFVYNLLRRGTYREGQVTYGEFGQHEEAVVDEEWFEVHVDFLFKDPPGSISVPSSSGGVRKTYLVRGPRRKALPKN